MPVAIMGPRLSKLGGVTVATYFRAITDEQAALIRNAHLFFVASADPSLGEGPEGVGPVNLSPKGGVSRCMCWAEQGRVSGLQGQRQ